METKKSLEHSVEANALVKKYMWYSMGAGIIPIPFVDLAALSGVQLKLLYDLSALYEVEFSQHKVQNIISTLAGILTASVTSGLVGSLVKIVPYILNYLKKVKELPAV